VLDLRSACFQPTLSPNRCDLHAFMHDNIFAARMRDQYSDIPARLRRTSRCTVRSAQHSKETSPPAPRNTGAHHATFCWSYRIASTVVQAIMDARAVESLGTLGLQPSPAHTAARSTVRACRSSRIQVQGVKLFESCRVQALNSDRRDNLRAELEHLQHAAHGQFAPERPLGNPMKFSIWTNRRPAAGTRRSSTVVERPRKRVDGRRIPAGPAPMIARSTGSFDRLAPDAAPWPIVRVGDQPLPSPHSMNRVFFGRPIHQEFFTRCETESYQVKGTNSCAEFAHQNGIAAFTGPTTFIPNTPACVKQPPPLLRGDQKLLADLGHLAEHSRRRFAGNAHQPGFARAMPFTIHRPARQQIDVPANSARPVRHHMPVSSRIEISMPPVSTTNRSSSACPA